MYKQKVLKYCSIIMIISLFVGGLPFHAFADVLVTTEGISNITTNSALLGGSISFTNGTNPTPKSVGFAYSTVQNDGAAAKITAPQNGNTFSVNCGGLLPDKIYYVRAYAISADTQNRDFYIYGNEISFRTKTTTNNIKVNTLIADYSLNQIYAQGAVSDDSHVTREGFLYSSTSTDLTMQTGIAIDSTSIGTNFEATFGIDTTKPSYYVRAFVVNDMGVNYGEVLRVEVDLQRPTVKTIEAKNVKANSAEIYFEVTDSGNRGVMDTGVVYSYEVDRPAINRDKTNFKYASGLIGYDHTQIENLKPETTYYARAFAETQSGFTYGQVVSFKTLTEKVDIGVTFVSAQGDTISSAKISSNIGAALTAKDLNLPEGFQIADSQWHYTVTKNENISVTLKLKEIEFFEGVGDFKFAPEMKATRAQIAQVMYNLSPNKAYQISGVHPDVPANHPNKTAIDFVSAKGFMIGDEFGNFKPDSNITRAETATVLCKFYNMLGNASPVFEDCKGHWAEGYISLVANAGMMTGYQNKVFSPDLFISRAEVCTVFSIAEKRSPVPLGKADFTDVLIDHWAYRYIMNASIPRQ